MNKPAASLLLFFIVTTCYGQPVQLAPPLLKYHSVFFKNTAIIKLVFAQRGTVIHYTLNNQQPLAKDKIYAAPIQIRNSITTIKAITTGKGFLPSEPVSATFIKEGLKIKSIHQSPANQKFPGSGTNTLIDNEGGVTDLNSKTWLGYQQDSVELNLLLDRKQLLSSLLIHSLQDHGGWVFLPEHIKVLYFNNSTQSFQILAEQFNPAKEIISGASCQLVIVNLNKKIKAEKIKVILYGVKSIPEPHPGKGTPAWLFIDEIKLY